MSDNDSNEGSEVNAGISQAYQEAATFLERFERFDCQELLTHCTTNWLLSTENFATSNQKLPTGLVQSWPNVKDPSMCILMIPVDPSVVVFDYKEIHQILRELTVGIYGCNQIPGISLDANFDQSTTCTLPPAYVDSKIGQILVECDYRMKSLWHGVFFSKEKRVKFCERWRTLLDVNAQGKPETKKPICQEFISAGLEDITNMDCYKNLFGGGAPAKETLASAALLTEEPRVGIRSPSMPEKLKAEMKYFMSKVDFIQMYMTVYQQSIRRHENIFFVDADWTVSSSIRLVEEQLDQNDYERLNSRLQNQEIFIKKYLETNPETRYYFTLLRLCAFLVPALIGMRKRMQIPLLSELLPPLIGDEIRTERELPPIVLPSTLKCPHFSYPSNTHFHLHGGVQVNLETPEFGEAPEWLHQEDWLTRLKTFANAIDRIANAKGPPQETYPTQYFEVNDQSYIVLPIHLETYYPQPPQSPLWVRAMLEEESKQRTKRIPLSDNHIHEQFKKYYGLKGALKNKSLINALRTTAQRGLVSMFLSITRKVNMSTISKQDDQGYSLMHHAALRNRFHIIGLLVQISQDVNTRRHNTFLSIDELVSKLGGPTPLHLAARSGSLYAVSCLISCGANVQVADNEGWTPVHHAAYFDHEHVITCFVKQFPHLIELRTRNESQMTPLLLACSSGALSSVKRLISLGASLLRQDKHGNGVVHLSAMHYHTNILEHFIECSYDEIGVWTVLVQMLKHEDEKKRESSVRCLEVLSISKEDHWKYILDAGGIPALISILQTGIRKLQLIAVSVLCNISDKTEVRQAITNQPNAAPILISLLKYQTSWEGESNSMETDLTAVSLLQSRTSVILSDLASLADNRVLFSQLDAIATLVNLLDSHQENVLVNAVNALRMLCVENQDNQSVIAATEPSVIRLVEFLTTPSEILQAAASSCIAALVKGHTANQDLLVASGAVKPLVDLVRGRGNVKVQVQAASAVQHLAEENPASQEVFLSLEAEEALIKLLKIWSVKVKEQASMSLKALAGHTIMQQKYIAQQIGISMLIELIMARSEKLQYCGCLSLMALCKENIVLQNAIAKDLGIQPLVRLLKYGRSSDVVLLTAIRCLGEMCVGVAFRNNPQTQKLIAAENAMEQLADLLNDSSCKDEIRIEVACTLGYLVLANKINQQVLSNIPQFNFNQLLTMMRQVSRHLLLRCCMSLTIFAFNNTLQQYSIRQCGGIHYSYLEPFLSSDNEYERCHAAFQIVVLARDILERDQVTLTAIGVTTLVEHLASKLTNVVILVGGYLASLSHTRAGIPDAIVTCGAVRALQRHLFSDSELVRRACGVALGYLTFNATASRILLKSCRETPYLFERLTENVKAGDYDSRISPEFIDSFERAKVVGLPCMYLEINGGPSVSGSPSSNAAFHERIDSGHSRSVISRAKSAPLRVKRPITAASRSTTKTQNHKDPLINNTSFAAKSNNSFNLPKPDSSSNARCKTAVLTK